MYLTHFYFHQKSREAKQQKTFPLMGCFAAQRAKKKLLEQPPTKPEEQGDESDAASSSPSTTPRATLSAPPSFRRTVKAIQNAQRFIIHTSPKIDGHEYRELKSEQGVVSSSDVGNPSKPMPLPSPKVSPRPVCYALPLPSDHTDAVVISPNSDGKPISSASVGHGGPTSKVFPWDLQPLPSLKDSFIVSRGMKYFTFEEIASACQYFSSPAAIGDDGFCFSGFLKAGGKGSKQPQQQNVVVARLHDKWHLGVKDWMPEMCAINGLPGSHLCKLIGSYGDDGKGERFLVYEKLQKGSLHTILFDALDTSALDWPTRMKVIQGTIQGLATLHEKFPEQILYKDFRLSHIQLDSENNAKLSGYWFVTRNNQTLQAQHLEKSSKARDIAYCAPETRHRGTNTLKSNVWSLGVVLLEILCGRKNMDERIAKDEKHDLVKWARPFLLEEDKLFLIMDPKLQGRFPAKGAKIMASLTLQCLQKDPTRRPSMKVALDMVKKAQEMRKSSVLTLREHWPTELAVISSGPLTNLSSSQSLRPGIVNRTAVSYMRSPTKVDLIQSPVLKPLTIPSRAWAD